MPNRGRRGRHPKGGRVTPKGTRPPDRGGRGWSAPAWDDEPDLFGDIRRRLRSGQPLDVLAEVSALLAALDPREYGFGRRPGKPPYSVRELVDMFLDVPQLEATVILAVIAELAGGDEMLAAHIRRGLDQRAARLPEWLARLPEAEVYGAQEMVHVLRDGDNVNLAVRFAGGAELTAVIYIDHNLGTLVKDAFVVPLPLAELEAISRAETDDPDTAWRDLELADARVRITDAIERGAMTVPPSETDTWPACRPIVEWLARRLPEGGRGYDRPEWSEEERQQLASRFFASPFGAPLDEPDHRDLLESVIWFGADYGPGDPLRWSAVAVEIILLDWIPRKIVADIAYLSKAPEILRAFVRFCHAERGIRAELTRETLAAIDEYEPDYQAAIRSARPQGPMAVLAAMGAVDPDGPWPMDNIDLRALDDRPLPDEAFDWSAIDGDIHDTVAEVLEQCDRCCDDLLDVEYRTACRRFLARAAAGDPAVFRRRASTATAAAAVCWIVGKDNDLFTPAGGGMLVKDLLAHFGLRQGGVSQRAATLATAAGLDPYWMPWELRLGAPELLVSRRRRRLIERREQYGTEE